MAGLMLAKHENCGDHIEGYTGPNGVERAAERFKQFGGVLGYITMDEPLYYGSVYPHGNACQSPIAEVAAEVASHVNRLRKIFPSIEVGEDEVVGLADQFQWLPTLGKWFEAYQSAVGTPLAFFHADIGWKSPRWPRQLEAISNLTRKSGVQFGIIYTGNPDDPDDATWSSHALERAQQIEYQLNIHPDQAIIFSWMPHPVAMLPSTDSTTLSGVLRCYIMMEQKVNGGGRGCPPAVK